MDYIREYWENKNLILKETLSISNEEMLNVYNHTNGYKLIIEWNRLSDLQEKMNPNKKWKYYLIKP